MLKILQARVQQYVNPELPEFKLDLESVEEPETNCQNPVDRRKSKGILEEHLLPFQWLH